MREELPREKRGNVGPTEGLRGPKWGHNDPTLRRHLRPRYQISDSANRLVPLSALSVLHLHNPRTESRKTPKRVQSFRPIPLRHRHFSRLPHRLDLHPEARPARSISPHRNPRRNLRSALPPPPDRHQRRIGPLEPQENHHRQLLHQNQSRSARASHRNHFIVFLGPDPEQLLLRQHFQQARERRRLHHPPSDLERRHVHPLHVDARRGRLEPDRHR